MMGEQQAVLIEALRELREAALFFIISSLLLSAGSTLLFFGLLTAVGISIHVAGLGAAVPGVLLYIVLVGATVAGAALALYALFRKLVPSLSKLSEYDIEFRTPSELVRIGFMVSLILFIVGILLVVIIIGLAVLILAYIMLILGYVGLAIVCFKLYSKLNSAIILTAGILFIVGVFIPILTFVAWILVYVECDTLILKLSRARSTAASAI